MYPKSLLSIAFIAIMHYHAPLALSTPVRKYTSMHTQEKVDPYDQYCVWHA